MLGFKLKRNGSFTIHHGGERVVVMLRYQNATHHIVINGPQSFRINRDDANVQLTPEPPPPPEPTAADNKPVKRRNSA